MNHKHAAILYSRNVPVRTMTTPRGPVEPSGGVVDSVDDNSSRWEEFKPLITKLYIDLDMKLSTVQQYVKQHHDFDAS